MGWGARKENSDGGFDHGDIFRSYTHTHTPSSLSSTACVRRTICIVFMYHRTRNVHRGYVYSFYYIFFSLLLLAFTGRHNQHPDVEKLKRCCRSEVKRDEGCLSNDTRQINPVLRVGRVKTRWLQYWFYIRGWLGFISPLVKQKLNQTHKLYRRIQ